MILEKISSLDDFKLLGREKLPVLAKEIRQRIIETTAVNGGHLAPSLGAVELVMALYRVYSSPQDKIIWDVGHQTYAFKLISGRADQFHTIRTLDGLSGYPHIDESKHDIFSAGHASVSISQAAGMIAARDLLNEKHHVVAVIGDASFTGGMAFEALNHIGHSGKDITIIINDNEMAISKNVGAISTYLNSLITNPTYNRTKASIDKQIKHIPGVGQFLSQASNKLEETVKGLIVDGLLFEELGFRYFGPFNGHRLDEMINTLNDLRQVPGPKVIHLVTKKGKGYVPAERDPERFHGTSPFDVDTGIIVEKKTIYKDIIKKKIVSLAKNDPSVVAVTAAMQKGTGLDEFAKLYPNRFFDVGIAEQHAVTFSCGLAKAGMKPFCAIYSTFFQRAVDQLIHDAAVQRLPVRFLVDRAGLVGDDGITHQGVFDITFIRMIPGVVLLAPRDGQEFIRMLNTAYHYDQGPIFIRYPRQPVNLHDLDWMDEETTEIQKAELLRSGKHITLLGLGTVMPLLLQAATELEKAGILCEVIDIRSVKPLDQNTIIKSLKKTKAFICVEDHVIAGGVGASILEMCSEYGVSVKNRLIGYGNEFVEHGTISELWQRYGLTSANIIQKVKDVLGKRKVSTG